MAETTTSSWDAKFVDLHGFEYRRPTADPTEDEAVGVPIVVLLGWTGSSPRALRKYAAVWNALGCKTLAACPGVAQLWRPATVRTQVLRLCEALTQIVAAGGPVVVHMFSGAVSMFLWHIAQCCSMGRLRVAGLVFDSCPVDYTRTSGLNAVRDMALPRLLRPLVAGVGVVVEWWSGATKREQLVASTSHPVLQVPALYLYCAEGDNVAPKASVDSWATEHAARGNPVMRQCWTTSAHVGHLRLHEADYKRAVAAFCSVHIVGVTGLPTESARL